MSIQLANLGPLRGLAGTWDAHKGVDLDPKAGGPERRAFVERNEPEPIHRRTGRNCFLWPAVIPSMPIPDLTDTNRLMTSRLTAKDDQYWPWRQQDGDSKRLFNFTILVSAV
jgi:hypothetical protein